MAWEIRPGGTFVRGGVGMYNQQHLLYYINRVQLEGPQGVAAVVKQRWLPLDAVKPAEGQVWVALDSVADPGNLGTVVRCADGQPGLDLVGANLAWLRGEAPGQLRAEALWRITRSARIVMANRNTVESADLHSYRRDGAEGYGRMLAMIGPLPLQEGTHGNHARAHRDASPDIGL